MLSSSQVSDAEKAPLPGSIMRIRRFATDRQGIMEGDNALVMADDLPRPYPH
jgi:hypothetical protein